MNSFVSIGGCLISNVSAMVPTHEALDEFTNYAPSHRTAQAFSQTQKHNELILVPILTGPLLAGN
jgi:hypothetical protein